MLALIIFFVQCEMGEEQGDRHYVQDDKRKMVGYQPKFTQLMICRRKRSIVVLKVGKFMYHDVISGMWQLRVRSLVL